MKITPNYGLKKPEGTDVVNVDDFNANADIIDGKLKELETNEIFYAVATGSANNYIVSIPALSSLTGYYDGLAVCVKINVLSTGASTLNVNGWGIKSILDSLGNQVTNGGLKVNTPYTLRYNGVNFILQGKGGGGNLTADKLLTGYNATGDTGLVEGTMVDNGGITLYPGAVVQTIPQGYHNGQGKVATDVNLIPGNIKAGATVFGVQGSSSVVDTADSTATADKILTGSNAYINGSKVAGTMVNNGAVTITPGATAKTIPPGYHNGSGTVATDVNLISANIKAGKTVFGVAGSSTVVDTADAVLDPQYLLTGYSGYDDGVKKAGTMTNLTGVRNATGVAQWGDGGLAVYPEKGYQKGGAGDGEIKVSVAQLQSADGDLNANNILNGITIFGITGNVTLASLGGKRTAFGVTTTATLNLSFTPDVVIIYLINQSDVTNYSTGTVLKLAVYEGSTGLNYQIKDAAGNANAYIQWGSGIAVSGGTVTISNLATGVSWRYVCIGY